MTAKDHTTEVITNIMPVIMMNTISSLAVASSPWQAQLGIFTRNSLVKIRGPICELGLGDSLILITGLKM